MHCFGPRVEGTYRPRTEQFFDALALAGLIAVAHGPSLIGDDTGVNPAFGLMGKLLSPEDVGRLLTCRVVPIVKHTDQQRVNRRPNGTHYRRAKGDHLAALRWG